MEDSGEKKSPAPDNTTPSDSVEARVPSVSVEGETLPHIPMEPTVRFPAPLSMPVKTTISTDQGSSDALVAENRASHEPIDVGSHTFMIPVKLIRPDDIPKWEHSEAYRDLIGFIQAMSDTVKGKKVSDDLPMSETLQKLLAMLEVMDKWIEEFPPIDQPQRFGNKAFRDWFAKLKQNADDILKTVVGEKFHPACPEISVYLVESVGNEVRIDYGTGHELAFVAFLCCLYKVGALTEDDAPALILRVFERYIELVRRLQTVYRMEPAGSHGVWSLDDHQFLPFLWGSSQLIGHKRILPKSFVKPEIFEHFSKEFIFLSAIKYIHQVKTGLFAEHSNQLWNISGVPRWEKVNSGLVKMYKAEVLAKFPVIQHFLFGSLLTLKPAT